MQFGLQVKFINPKTMLAPFGYTNMVDLRNGRTIYVFDQVVLNQEVQVVGVGDIVRQQKQVFENIKFALDEAEVSFNWSTLMWSIDKRMRAVFIGLAAWLMAFGSGGVSMEGVTGGVGDSRKVR
jgi:enamine deaminase RidA (YjgF/YER057c/UK114 family)